jgi:hypothetical protein
MIIEGVEGRKAKDAGSFVASSFLEEADRMSATARPVTTESKMVSPIFISYIDAQKTLSILTLALEMLV